MDRYGFYTGQSFDAYEYLGAHDVPTGTVFRAFAPNAAGVCVVYGESGSVQEMCPICDGNFYEAYIEGIGPGTPYEYRIYLRNGQFVDHCDPCGFGMELRPQHRSIVRSLSGYKFRTPNGWSSGRTAWKNLSTSMRCTLAPGKKV